MLLKNHFVKKSAEDGNQQTDQEQDKKQGNTAGQTASSAGIPAAAAVHAIHIRSAAEQSQQQAPPAEQDQTDTAETAVITPFDGSDLGAGTIRTTHRLDFIVVLLRH